MSYRTAAQLLPTVGEGPRPWVATLVYLDKGGGEIRVGPFPDRADLSAFGALVLCTLPSEGEPELLRPPRGISNPRGTSGIVRCAIDDYQIPKKDYRRVAAAALRVARFVRRGEKVVLCCMQGRNRSTLLAALAVRALGGSSGEAIVEHMKSARDRDLAGKDSFTNPWFVAFLRNLPDRSRRRSLVP